MILSDIWIECKTLMYSYKSKGFKFNLPVLLNTMLKVRLLALINLECKNLLMIAIFIFFCQSHTFVRPTHTFIRVTHSFVRLTHTFVRVTHRKSDWHTEKSELHPQFFF